jgi:hypothetical protein
MSQVADFYVIPDSAVADIRQAALPKKTGWLSRPKDAFWETLWMHAGRSRMDYGWSGYGFVVLFEYLREKKNFDIAAPGGIRSRGISL